MNRVGPGATLSPLIHLIDDDEAVRSGLALLISTVGLRVQAWPDLIVAGLTNKDIGRALDVSPRTVESHRANLFAKLEAESLAQLIRHYASLVDANP